MDRNPVTATFFSVNAAPHSLTEVTIFDSIKRTHPRALITYSPAQQTYPLLQFAAAGLATLTPLSNDGSCTSRFFMPPARRLDDQEGRIFKDVLFDVYIFGWKSRKWLLYVATGRDGSQAFPRSYAQYLVSGSGVPEAVGVPPAAVASDELVAERIALGEGSTRASLQGEDDALLKAVTEWLVELREEIWVFNGGVWQKDRELFKSVEKASWNNVILDSEKKHTIQADAQRFFDGREKYERLGVPWKRGVIFYGPPGNGKTISIKALMRTLYHRKQRVPTLYVRSLASFAGPEYSITQIFTKARQYAPCLLVFEDLDSLVTPQVRSFFLNEVDGLASNRGIYMIGSTNHLSKLDPGISKRPSRFDRKYEFSKPDLHERTLYAEFWRRKILGGDAAAAAAGDEDADWDKDFEEDFEEMRITTTPTTGGGGGKDGLAVDFPKGLCPKMADITGGFSFAYMQEAFIAALLSIASEDEDEESETKSDSDKDLEKLRLWKEFKAQVANLRREIL